MSSRFYGLEFRELIQLKLELLKYIERKFKSCLGREEVDDFSYKLFVESKNFNSTLPISFTFNPKLFENRQQIEVLIQILVYQNFGSCI